MLWRVDHLLCAACVRADHWRVVLPALWPLSRFQGREGRPLRGRRWRRRGGARAWGWPGRRRLWQGRGQRVVAVVDGWDASAQPVVGHERWRRRVRRPPVPVAHPFHLPQGETLEAAAEAQEQSVWVERGRLRTQAVGGGRRGGGRGGRWQEVGGRSCQRRRAPLPRGGRRRRRVRRGEAAQQRVEELPQIRRLPTRRPAAASTSRPAAAATRPPTRPRVRPPPPPLPPPARRRAMPARARACTPSPSRGGVSC